MPYNDPMSGGGHAAIAVNPEDSRLKLVLEAALVGTWERNLLTGEDTWSEQEEALFGLAPGTFASTHVSFLDMVEPTDRAALEAAARRAIEGSSRYESDFRVRRADGSVRWMIGRGDVIRDENGRATHMVGITMDITERKLSQQRMATEHAVSRVLSIASSMEEATPAGAGCDPRDHGLAMGGVVDGRSEPECAQVRSLLARCGGGAGRV